MKKVLWLILVITMVVSGCRTATDTPQKSDLSTLTPKQVVETYYNSIALGDYTTAKALMSNEIAELYVESPDSDFNNIKKLKVLTISDPDPKKLYGTNFDEVLVTVEYDAQYKEEITSTNGEQLRFIYVAKKEQDSAWKIISIGTGP